MNDILTTKAYWEDYYNAQGLSQDRIVSICGSYDSVWYKFIGSASSGKTIIEVGAYPGRYIAYLAAKYELLPTALDYNSDKQAIEKAFDVMGVKKYRIIQKDFLTYTSSQTYDFVYSLGFIEHFKNFDGVLDRHVNLLKPGGMLLVMVPNKRWFRKWYDYLCDYDNLKIHNTKCMSKKVFHRFAKRNALEPVFIGYFGGFAYNVHQELNFFQRIIYGLVRRLFRFLNPYIAKRPNRFFSSTLVAIFKRPV